MGEGIGQRQLAAIVFTDVAGFSSKASTDEERVLHRVREDLDLLTGLSGTYHGNVVKTTGDGLLISFASAVDAVSFAIEGQRRIIARNESLPPADHRLDHRMGIHLGDIFISESDAMGDGVNIAARLQAEAEPGGICISQTVYDVVKNKLAIRAVSLGPRELKNIRDSIYAYRIVVDAESSRARGAVPPRTSVLRKRVGAWRRGITAVLLLMALAVTLKAVRKHRTAERVKAAPSPSAAVTPAPLLASAPAPASPPTAGAAALDEGRLARVTWIRRQMARHGKENPLAVMLPKRIEEGPGRKEIMVWLEGDMLMLKSGRDVMRRRLEQLPPRMLAAIAVALARESRGAGMPSPAATP